MLACIHHRNDPTRNPYALELFIVLILLFVGVSWRAVVPRRSRVPHRSLAIVTGVVAAIAVCATVVMVSVYTARTEREAVCGVVLQSAIALTACIYADIVHRLRREVPVPRAVVSAVGGATRWWRRR